MIKIYILIFFCTFFAFNISSQTINYDLISKGHECFKKKQWSEAIDFYKKAGCVNKNSECPVIVYTKIKEATSNLVPKKDPLKENTLSKNALKYYMQGKQEMLTASKISLFDKAISLDNNMEDAYFYRGKAYYESTPRNLLAAQSDFEKALSLDPFDEGNILWSGYVAVDLNQIGRAMRYLNSEVITTEKVKEYAKEQIKSLKASFSDCVKFNRVWLEGEVYNSKAEKGIIIHMDVDIHGFKDETVHSIAYFFNKNHTKYENNEVPNEYKGQDGQLQLLKEYKPRTNDENIYDYKIFVPENLFMSPKTSATELLVRIQFWNPSCGFIGPESDFISLKFH